ncbi:hypothetical protein O6H91_15G085200 [Diphasiastrum complanatum]|uniref:Uncharacterized protein n=1 Tax=Diphasiastrum complanatum TaxID=34168 RepID=A0ACC2BKC6_DIPCM|nr:hypothetical protein O6H91_15G085200 [Diphasiastrum complanatum]
MHMKAQMEVHKTGAYIKSLSLRGFKSFGGDAQTITFSKGMNLIAGANGSGKSNILDAICFALCERTSSLRVHHICEVQSSDTDEPCEVALEIANETTHATQVITSLSVKLLPDGASRQIKLDGKLKALKEVKEFLREKRLLLEETSAVLYQSRVTELADKNSASVLAAIISGASGAGRWNEEVEKTQQELKKVRKGLEEIKDNIVTLEKAISEDNGVKSISRLNELTIKMTNLSIRLSNYQKNKLMQLKENICEQTELMKFKETCIQEQQLRLQTRQASIIAMRKSEQALIEQLRKDRSSLLDQLAIKEGKKESIEKKIEDAEKNKKELDHYSRTEGNMQAKISLLEAQLKEKQARVSRLQVGVDLHAKHGEFRKPLMLYVEELQGAIVNGDQRLQELQCQEDMVTKELQKLVGMKLLKEKERFNIQQDYEQWMPNSPDISSQITSASQSFDNFMEIRAYLKTRQVELDRELQILGSQLGHLSADEQALPAWPLHACFKFKAHEYGDVNFRTPLGVISGCLEIKL